MKILLFGASDSRLDTHNEMVGLALAEWQRGVSAVLRELAAHGTLGTKT